MVRIAATWIALALAAGVAPTAAARDSGAAASPPAYELKADELEYDSQTEIYVASGSVVIRRGERTLSADWASFSNRTRRGVASGNVVLSEGRDVLRAEFVEFDVDALTGVVFQARLDSEDSHFRMQGAEIRKTGDATYGLKDGTFTTCRCDDEEGRASWRIRAREVEAEIGGYATVRNATFEVLDVPILWLPWMKYPMSERKSGFLMPELGYGSRDGARVGLPFFWAAADPINVILTPSWIQQRGVKGDLALDFVYGEQSDGEVYGSFIHDDSIDPAAPATPFGDERWVVTGEQDAFLPKGWRAKADFRFMSDNDYVLDFEDMRRYRTRRFLESNAWVGNALGEAGRFFLQASARVADGLANPDDVDRDRYLMQRLPDVAFSVLPAPLPWTSHVVAALDTRFIYFYPWQRAGDVVPLAPLPGGAEVVGNDLFLDTGIDATPNAEERDPATGSFDASDHHGDDFAPANPAGTEGNGVFDEGEPLADRGQRFEIAPRLALPWRLGDVAELYPEVSWVQTLYASHAQGFEERGLLTVRADLRTRLRRRFGTSLTHVLEPRVGYAFVRKTSQSDNPLYVPATAVPQERLRQLDLGNVVRDPADRIGRFNGVTLGFGNRIFRRPADGGAPRLLADFAVSAGYEFFEGEFANVYLDGRTYAWGGTAARFSLGIDPTGPKIDEGLAELAWRAEAGHALALRYRWLRDIPASFENFPFGERYENFEAFDHVNQASLRLRVALAERWALTYRVEYAFENSDLLGNEGGIEYVSRCRCWAVRLEVGGDQASGVQAGLRLRFMGLGDDATPFTSITGLGLLDAP
ncbi:MAG: LPS assembly protein LptD [Myxococcales bacterium]|nr:LPS assembly protein LptD [Myxococcales bacterium]